MSQKIKIGSSEKGTDVGNVPNILIPATPFERRMIEFSLQHKIPPIGTPEAAHLQRLMDIDVGFQLKLKSAQKRLSCIAHAQMTNGSGMQQSNLLRFYFHEYFNRYVAHGPGSFPTSFNVVESFMAYNSTDHLFELRHEREHLLSVDDYFRWYVKGEIPNNPAILQSIMSEGVIYSYDMLIDEASTRIYGGSAQIIAGVSLVRHEHELSCLLLAGENPPHPSNNEISDINLGKTIPGKEGLEPAPNLTIKDRYLDGNPEFARVIVLTRIDLKAGRHDVRYVNLDVGKSFNVYTDDTSIFGEVTSEELQEYRRVALGGLARYDNLFSTLSSLIYLPAFFAAFPERVRELKVLTRLHAKREEKEERETISELQGAKCIKHRKIRCFQTVHDDAASIRQIKPPELEFKCDGYWKPIGPHEVGEDKNGERIFGQTWVSKSESWAAGSPQAFMLEKQFSEPNGPDPGTVYVQRSPALDYNLYKIGMSRRSAEIRAEELSAASGVPLPYDVVATWSVGDCSAIERKVHERLAAYRVNPRREFFRLELKQIVTTIHEVIRDLEKS